MKKNVLEVLSEKHDDWIHMAMSLGICRDDAHELVSRMYINMYSYVKDVDRIMYSETEVNTFFVYSTIKNLFKTGYHLNGKTGGMFRNRFVRVANNSFWEQEDLLLINETDNVDEEDEYDVKLNIQDSLVRELNDETDALYNRDYTESFFDAAFGNVVDDIKGIVDKWGWYDKKMFKLHFANLYDSESKGMSMRDISRKTKITLKSVFLTLKACKLRIREELQEDYNKWKQSKKDT